MGRKMIPIETMYIFGGNFKSIIKILIIASSFTLIEVDCKDELSNFIVQKFKLEKEQDD